MLDLSGLIAKLNKQTETIATLRREVMERDLVIHILEHRLKPKKRGRPKKTDV